MSDGLDDLLAALALDEVAPGTFVGRGDIENEYGLYGGHLLGQGVAAVCRTVPEGRAIHSLHAYFVAGGAASGDLTYHVERVRDGATFAHRQVVAERDGRELFRLAASFQAAEDGLAWAPPGSPIELEGLPGPEGLPDLPQLLASRPTPPFDEYWANRPRAVELRYARAPWADAGPAGDQGIRVWWRTRRPLGDDPALHAAVAAYVADESISDNVLTPHGLTWGGEGLMVVSLDHAMWFHRPFRVDEWLLAAQRPLVTGAARGLAFGQVYDRSGTLVATYTQEALLRT